MSGRAVLVAGTAILWLGAADGAESLGYVWADGTVRISTGDLVATQPESGNWQEAFATAAARWSDSTLVTVTTDRDTQAGDCRNTGPNTALFMSTFCGTSWGTTILATARTFYFDDGPRGGQATHTDVVFRSSINWVVADGPVFGGRVDFRRVAVHELGHSIGLDHTPDPSAIMYFRIGQTISPRTDDVFGTNRLYGAETDQVVKIEDLDGNGWQELGVILLDSDGRYVLQVRDGGSGAELARLVLGPRPLISMTVSPDVTGNGRPEFIALTRQSDGASKLRVFDLETGALIAKRRLSAKVDWVDVIATDDTDGGGLPDMVPVGIDGDGSIKAPIFDVATAAKTGGLRFGRAEEVIQLAALPDADGDLLPEIVALVRDLRGVAVARIRSGANGGPVANVSFGPDYTPLGLAVAPDGDGNGAPELIQIGRNAAGRIRVVRRDIGPGAATSKAFFAASNRPFGVIALGDLNGDGVADHGVVLEQEGSDPRLRLLDGLTSKVFGTIFYAGIGDARDVVLTQDPGASGRRDVAILGNLNGTYRIQTRDSRSGSELSTVVYQ
jgi:hypothetical protein